MDVLELRRLLRPADHDVVLRDRDAVAPRLAHHVEHRAVVADEARQRPAGHLPLRGRAEAFGRGVGGDDDVALVDDQRRIGNGAPERLETARRSCRGLLAHAEAGRQTGAQRAQDLGRIGQASAGARRRCPRAVEAVEIPAEVLARRADAEVAPVEREHRLVLAGRSCRRAPRPSGARLRPAAGERCGDLPRQPGPARGRRGRSSPRRRRRAPAPAGRSRRRGCRRWRCTGMPTARFTAPIAAPVGASRCRTGSGCGRAP